MSLIINNNLSALNTHRNLSRSGSSMSKAIEKLSSGYQINVGADDPSGLIISEQLRSQISGLERAVRNSSEASNLIGIAEGALNEMNSILKKMRALAIHAANSGVTSPEQVAADQAEMDSGIATLDRIANTTRYSDQYLLNGSKELVYDVNTIINGPNDHQLLDTKQTRVDQIFKRDGVKMSVGFAGEKNRYQANTETSAKRAYLEADNAEGLCQIDDQGRVTAKQEFILTGSQGSRMFTFKQGEHLGEIVSSINNVRDSTGIGATLTFASDIRIDKTTNGTYNGSKPDYDNNIPAEGKGGYDDGSYVYKCGDVQIYGAGLNNPETSKIKNVSITPDAAAAFKVGFNCDGDGKVYAKIVDKASNSIEYYKDRECTMLIGKGDSSYFAATNNSGIPSSPVQNMDGIFIELNPDNCENLDVFEIGLVGQRLDNQKDMDVSGLQGWSMTDHSVISGVNLGVNTSEKGQIYFRYKPLSFAEDGKTVATFQVEAFTDQSYEKQYLVASSGVIQNNMNTYKEGVENDPLVIGDDAAVQEQLSGQTVRLESVIMDNGQESGLTITMNIPKPGVLEGITGMTLDDMRKDPEYEDFFKEYDAQEPLYKAAVEKYKADQEAVKAAEKLEETAQKEYDLAKAAYDRAVEKREEAQANYDAALGDYMDGKNEFEANIQSTLNNLIQTSGMMDAALDELNAMVGGYPNEFGEKFLEEIANQTRRTFRSGSFLASDTSIDTYVNRLTGNIRNAIENSTTGYYRYFDGTGDQAAADAVLTRLMTTVGDHVKAELHDAMTAKLETYDSADDVDASAAAVRNSNAAGMPANYAILDAVPTTNTAYPTPANTLEDQLRDEITNAVNSYLDTHRPALGDSATDYYTALVTDVHDALTTLAAPSDPATDNVYTTLSEATVPGGSTAIQRRNAGEAIINAILADMQSDIESEVNAAFKSVATDFRQTDAQTIDDVVRADKANVQANLNTLNDVIDPKTVRSGYGYTFVKEFVANLASWMDSELADNTYPNTPAGMALFRDELIAQAGTIVGDMTATGKYSHIFGGQTPPKDAEALNHITTITDGIIDAIDFKLTGKTKTEIKDMVAGGDPTQLQRIANAALNDGVYLKDDFDLLNSKGLAGNKLVEQIKTLAEDYFQNNDLEITNTNKDSALTDYLSDLRSDVINAIQGQSPYTDLLDPIDQGTADTFIGNLLTTIETNFRTSVVSHVEARVVEPPEDRKYDSVVDAHRTTGSTQWTTIEGTSNGDEFAAAVRDKIADELGSFTASSIADIDAFIDSFVTDVTAAIKSAEPYNTTWGSNAGARSAADTVITAILGDVETRLRDEFEAAVNTDFRAKTGVEDTIDLAINPPGPIPTALDTLNNVPTGPGGTLNNYGDQLLDEIEARVKAYLDDDDKYAGYSASTFRNTFKDKILEEIKTATDGVYAKLNDTELEEAAELIVKESLDRLTTPVKDEPDYFRNYTDAKSNYLKAETKLQAAEDAEEAAEAAMDAKEVLLDEAHEKTLEAQEKLDESTEELKAMNEIWEPLKKQYDAYSASATSANGKTPTGEQVGSITFKNLGMRIYSMDYGSAETIRIQNKSGQLFYQYRDDDSMDKKMVEADTTVQVNGNDAQITLNGAPIFTTGLIANTTTPDFSGSLVFNAGTLGKTTLAVAGYDVGKLYSKATDLQGVEENEPDIQTMDRSFEPPALTIPMGYGDPAAGTATGLRNAQNMPISLHLDFTQLDPTVAVKVTNLGNPTDVKVTYEYDDESGTGKIRIDASRLLPIDSEGLEKIATTKSEYTDRIGNPAPTDQRIIDWRAEYDALTNDEDRTAKLAELDEVLEQDFLDARGELIIEEAVNVSNLEAGYYVTNPNLKGMYIRTSGLIDMPRSQVSEGPIVAQTTPDNGELLLEVNTYATNPRSTTSESMSDFVGGMQFQLGATEGNQDRTIYSIQSMSMSNLGRITWEGVDYCLQDVLGGGIASLTKDPILAMRVLQQAVDDVSGLRSRLGAFQSNMLQTNINSLEVAIENITKTESAIRDTDMAAESTQFTRFQIMQQAGTSMLAQANQISQNVLSLLQ